MSSLFLTNFIFKAYYKALKLNQDFRSRSEEFRIVGGDQEDRISEKIFLNIDGSKDHQIFFEIDRV